MISTRRDRSIATFIQELNQHIRRQENQMCAGMIDLKKKLKVFMGFPATGGEDDDCTCPENYIIIDDTDSDPDDSDDDFVDEAGADIMESSTDQFF